MAGFTYDAEKFNRAAISMNDAAHSFSGLTGLISDVLSNYPPEYKHKNEVFNACIGLKKAIKFSNNYNEKLDKTGASLSKLDSNGSNTGNNSWFDDIVDAFTDTGAALGNGITSLLAGNGWGDMNEAFRQTKATLFVTGTSIIGGAFRVVEHIYDGFLYTYGYGVSSIYDLFGAKKEAQKTRDRTLDYIRNDIVTDSANFFYKKTDAGRNINKISNLKYNSKGAQKISETSEFLTKVAAATVTGNSGFLALGALYGAGRSAEKYARGVNRDAGKTYNHFESFMKTSVGAAMGATEWWGYSVLGNKLSHGINGLASLRASGAHMSLGSVTSILNPKNILSFARETKKTFSSKLFLSAWYREATALHSILPTAATVSDHCVNFIFGDELFGEAFRNIRNELLFSGALDVLSSAIDTRLSIKSIKNILDLDSYGYNRELNMEYAFKNLFDKFGYKTIYKDIDNYVKNGQGDEFLLQLYKKLSNAELVNYKDNLDMLYGPGQKWKSWLKGVLGKNTFASASEIDDYLKNNVRFLNREKFLKEALSSGFSQEELGYLEGFYNNTDNITRNLRSYVPTCDKEVLVHESMHRFSTEFSHGKSIHCGFETDKNLYLYRGFNEACTERQTGNALPECREHILNWAGYSQRSQFLKQMLGITKKWNPSVRIDDSVLKSAYHSGNTSAIRSKIDSVMGLDYFETNILPAFNNLGNEDYLVKNFDVNWRKILYDMGKAKA